MTLANRLLVIARITLCAVVALTFSSAERATGIVLPGESLLVNGDFATGDLTGWTALPDPGGAPGVLGVSSYSGGGGAEEESLISGAVFNGGSLVQSVDLAAGHLVIAANVASVIDEISFPSFVGGPSSTFELLLNGSVVDTVTIESTNFTLQQDELLFVTELTSAGSYEVGVRHIASDPPVNIPGDGNGNGQIDLGDFTVWADHFQQQGGSMLVGDFNLNGTVELGDFTIWADFYGRNYNPTHFVQDVQAVVFDELPGEFGGGGGIATPEPGSLVIWSIFGGLLAIVAWRRRRKPHPTA